MLDDQTFTKNIVMKELLNNQSEISVIFLSWDVLLDYRVYYQYMRYR